MEEPEKPEAREIESPSLEGQPDGADQPDAAEPPAAAERPEPAQEAVPSGSSDERWRRLHRTSGAIFLGVFLVIHLLTNASALGGVDAWESVVGKMLRSKLLPLIEVFVLVPLAIHAFCGVRLLRRNGTPDEEMERYGDRRLWRAQRVTAVIVLVFVVGHVLSLRGQRLFFGLSAEAVHTVLVAQLSSSWIGVPWVALLYLVGIGAAAAHFSNGLVAATASWRAGKEATVGRRMRIGAVALGLALFTVGAATVIGLATGPRLFEWSRPGLGTPCGPAGSSPSH
jgi:succinate dehydrogenase / fumarate reductase cytochrome b subunit